MEEFITTLDNVLTIIGAFSIIVSVLKFFLNPKKWDSSVKIYCVDNEEEILNKYKNIKIINLEGKPITVIEPNGHPISSIKVFTAKLNKKGKVKKDTFICEEKNILPNNACIIYADYSCGMPNTIVEIKNYYGGKFDMIFYENGFNGNKDYTNGIEWKYPLYIKIFNSIFK